MGHLPSPHVSHFLQASLGHYRAKIRKEFGYCLWCFPLLLVAYTILFESFLHQDVKSSSAGPRLPGAAGEVTDPKLALPKYSSSCQAIIISSSLTNPDCVHLLLFALKDKTPCQPFKRETNYWEFLAHRSSSAFADIFSPLSSPDIPLSFPTCHLKCTISYAYRPS